MAVSEELPGPYVLLTITPSGKVNRTLFPSQTEARCAGALALYAEKAHEYKRLLDAPTLEGLWLWWRRESGWPSLSSSGGRWELPVPAIRPGASGLIASSITRWPDNVVAAEVYPSEDVEVLNQNFSL